MVVCNRYIEEIILLAHLLLKMYLLADVLIPSGSIFHKDASLWVKELVFDTEFTSSNGDWMISAVRTTVFLPGPEGR